MLASQITQTHYAPTLPDEDLALVQAAKDGGITAFEELVKKHERRMFRIAHGLLHNREDAEDAIQEAFLNAFCKLSQFQAKSKFSTWLARITVNQALTKLRKEPVSWSSLQDESQDEAGPLPHEIVDWAPSPEMAYSSTELRNILGRNLRRLNPKLRAVFLLHDVEGLSLEESAQALGLSVPAVKARSWRARFQLRELLNRYFRGDKHPPFASMANKHALHV